MLCSSLALCLLQIQRSVTKPVEIKDDRENWKEAKKKKKVSHKQNQTLERKMD